MCCKPFAYRTFISRYIKNMTFCLTDFYTCIYYTMTHFYLLQDLTFKEELELMKDLQHQNIASYYGTQQKDGWMFIFIEYIPGVSQRRM